MSDIPELDAERFIRLSMDVYGHATLKVNADLSLEMHVDNFDRTISIYLGPSPDSMRWSEYQDFLRTMGVM